MKTAIKFKLMNEWMNSLEQRMNVNRKLLLICKIGILFITVLTEHVNKNNHVNNQNLWNLSWKEDEEQNLFSPCKNNF